MLLSDLLREYIATHPAIRSAQSENLYLIVLRHYGAFLEHEPATADFTEKNLVSYMRHRRARGRADATIDNECVKLMVLWRYAAKLGHATEPTLQIRRTKPESPRALLRHEVRALFRASTRATGTIGGIPANIYFPAILGVIWNTAERIRAVHSIERSDLDLRARCATFRTRKGRGQIVHRPLSRSSVKAIKKLLAQHDRPKPFAAVGLATVYYHLDRLLIDAKIAPERRNKFHALRRSHASYLFAAGGDATASLGHDSEKTTRVHYFDPRITVRRSAVTLLFHPLSLWSRLLAAVGL